MTARAHGAGRLGRMLAENIVYKAVALVAALVFFYTFQTERTGTRNLSCDLMAIMDAAGDRYVLTSQIPSQVVMKIEGPMNVLKAIRKEDIGPLIISIGDYRSKDYRFSGKAVNTLPPKVRIVRFYPETIPLHFEKKVRKTVPVVAVIDASSLHGRTYRTPVGVVPDTIGVTGAEGSMAKVEKWETQQIFVDALAPGVHEIKAGLVPTKIPNVAPDGEEVVVRIEISYKIVERWLRDLPVTVEGTGGAAARPEKVSVLLKGPEELLKGLAAESIDAFVDTGPPGSPSPASALWEVKLSGLPEATAAVKIVPPKVQVTIRKK